MICFVFQSSCRVHFWYFVKSSDNHVQCGGDNYPLWILYSLSQSRVTWPCLFCGYHQDYHHLFGRHKRSDLREENDCLILEEIVKSKHERKWKLTFHSFYENPDKAINIAKTLSCWALNCRICYYICKAQMMQCLTYRFLKVK